MRPFSVLMFITAGLLLIMRHPAISESLPKPTLLVNTNDADDVIMEGNTISISCETTYRKAKKFFLTCLSTNETIEQKGSQFTLQITSGAHTCKYCDKAACSEPSDPQHIYVRDKLPEPIISVKPSKIVHSGDRVTITCSAHYEDIIFFLYKDNKLVKEDAVSRNTTSYEIQSIEKKYTGQYMCRYNKTTNNGLMRSHPSDPLMIRIKDLPKPTVSLQFPKDDSGSVIIHCTAPRSYSWVWFQLLRENKTVAQEKENTQETSATFTIKDLNEKYHCIYRIRIGTDFADSKLSEAVFLGKDDHTTCNVIRLVIAGFLLIIACLILRNHISEHQNLNERAPDLPAAQVLFVEESEEIQIQNEPAKENEYKV